MAHPYRIKLVAMVKQIAKILGERVIGIYTIFFAISLLFVNYPFVIAHAKSMTLSRMMPPSYEYIVRLAQGKAPLETKKIQEFHKYYRKVIEFMPYLPDGFGLVGFCQYQLNDIPAAIKSYKEAIELNPGFINFYYNMGVIYFSEGRFLAAAECFRFGAGTKIDENLNFLTSSKLYFPLFMIDQTAEAALVNLKSHLKEEYKLCYKALALSYYYAKKYKEVIETAEDAIESELGDKEFFCYFAGISAYRLGNPKMAIRFLNERIEFRPNDVEAMYFLGVSYRDLKEEGKATDYFEKIALLRQAKKVESNQDQRRFSLLLY